MQLHDLRAPEGANKGRKRVGRGESSGWGKTAGRGGKGQTARTGKGKPGLGFEGGQMPMYRRMPKRGFVNIFRRNIFEINLDMLSQHFESGAEVNLDALRTLGLFGRKIEMLRILGRGELAYPLKVQADHFTAGARAKIEAAGGQAIAVAPRGAKA
ncbi:MAG: 50S ribosomal protein L15 [Oxalobacteraceae bacterium]|nr:MAG: 50S ribosomal protein L15 [Oxalobacteraceae bacterium]